MSKRRHYYDANLNAPLAKRTKLTSSSTTSPTPPAQQTTLEEEVHEAAVATQNLLLIDVDYAMKVLRVRAPRMFLSCVAIGLTPMRLIAEKCCRAAASHGKICGRIRRSRKRVCARYS